MKKRIIFTTLPLLLIIALVASPVLAKDPEPPEKGLLWETLDSLQQQIEEGLSSLAQQLAEGLNALQGQINAIQDRLETLEAFDEIDPTVDEMVKDGIAWNEISDIPVGFADGTDDVGAGGSLKHLVNNFIVASGHSVTAGDVVTFLDGVIQKGHFQGDEIAFSSGYAYNPASTRGMSAAALSETQFVVVYKDWDHNYYDTAIIGDISGGTITYGPEEVFCSAGTDFDNFGPKVTALSPTKFVVAYNDVGNSDYGTARIGTISGTTISFGSTYVFNDDDTYSDQLSVSALSEDSFVVAYCDTGNSFYGTAIIGTVSGSDITFGSEYVYNPAGSTYNRVVALSETKIVVAYQDGGSSPFSGTAIVGEVAGDTITFGSEYEFNADQTDYISAAALSESQFVVAYEDDGNSNYGTAIIGGVSGNTITFGTEEVFNTASPWYISVTTISPDKFVIAYRDTGNSDYGTAIVGDVSGNSIAFGSEYSFNSAATGYIWATTLSEKQFVVVYMDPGSSNTFHGIAKIGDVASQGKVIGIAKAAAGEGEAVPVIIIGVSDVHSGLVAGQTYFATTAGDLTTSVTDYRIGFAVSESELFLSIPAP